ncbi:hypothetical protein [Oceanivirga salmonicida]|uniref:hypothetical protein n=1 Tax=Oceanivirga salmonicida TaxID=1769291 RepID=UPI0012E265A2|nr:hypothetical protein [Oceanivirga salmonicida]
MKIKFKSFDIQKLSIPKFVLIAIWIMLIIEKVYVLPLEFGKFFIIDFIGMYIYINFFLNIEIKFLENELHIIKISRFFKNEVFKLKYRDIKMIKVTDNLFGTKNISLNHAFRGNRITSIFLFFHLCFFKFNTFFQEPQNMGYKTKYILLPNIVNHKEILEKLNEKTNIDINSICMTQVSHRLSIKNYIGFLRMIFYFSISVFILSSDYNPIWLIVVYIFISLPILKNKKYFININDDILKVASENDNTFFINNFEFDENKVIIKTNSFPFLSIFFISECNFSWKLKIEK